MTLILLIIQLSRAVDLQLSKAGKIVSLFFLLFSRPIMKDVANGAAPNNTEQRSRRQRISFRTK